MDQNGHGLGVTADEQGRLFVCNEDRARVHMVSAPDGVYRGGGAEERGGRNTVQNSLAQPFYVSSRGSPDGRRSPSERLLPSQLMH